MITFKFVKSTGPLYDCEYCGSHSSENMDVYVNEQPVWHQHSDGHMGFDQTEQSLSSCVLKAWNDIVVQGIEAAHSEEARHEWNKKCPGNAIATSVESWAAEKASMLSFQAQNLEQVSAYCQTLPHREVLQLKMIALWIEDVTGDTVNVEEEELFDEEI